MLLSLKAVAVGSSITSANPVSHYIRCWNSVIENQGTDRAYRIGQMNEVYSEYLKNCFEDSSLFL